ncbi:uncharacterized protein BJ171DRAFT_593758 [Polychytrium aggregatum]|uniref:uncharacterized protein n=1 Tax=Polychytrium aggregatum TaxID=110093 RepID=UPI0022FF06E9|nr:uncharacterized protein BJ171DRAFT_593758 [Polychytrium aggregatum]KAI9183778.1 hypothetical protein BJ171DRAFT_593758 [Polychytrium aggregatum]
MASSSLVTMIYCSLRCSRTSLCQPGCDLAFHFLLVRLSRHSRDLERGKSDVGIFDLHVVDKRIFIFSPSKVVSVDQSKAATHIFEIPAEHPDELFKITDSQNGLYVEIVHSRELKNK